MKGLDFKGGPAAGPGESVDSLLDGRLTLIQSETGYRFSLDALLLADFVTVRPGDVVVDLGTGCGVISLILLFSRPVARVLALEIQGELCRQAVRNAEINGFSDRMAVIRGDLRSLPFRSSWADAVVCNPPYRKAGSGRVNPDSQRAVARHELAGGLRDVARSASMLLKPMGRVAIVYPAERLADLFGHLRSVNLEPKRLKMIHPSPRTGAKLALVEATAGGRPGLKVEAPSFT